MWYQNNRSASSDFVTKHACDRQRDKRTELRIGYVLRMNWWIATADVFSLTHGTNMSHCFLTDRWDTFVLFIASPTTVIHVWFFICSSNPFFSKRFFYIHTYIYHVQPTVPKGLNLAQFLLSSVLWAANVADE